MEEEEFYIYERIQKVSGSHYVLISVRDMEIHGLKEGDLLLMKIKNMKIKKKGV